MIAQNKNFVQWEVVMKADYFDLPVIAQDFLSYMDTIKGKSINTVHEYHYDLRSFFRFFTRYEEKLLKADTEKKIYKEVKEQPPQKPFFNHILFSRKPGAKASGKFVLIYS